jgi:hypothetical protein
MLTAPRHTQIGLTLVEAMLVVAAMSLILVASVGTARLLNKGVDANATAQAIRTVIQNIHASYRGTDSYEALSTASVEARREIPEILMNPAYMSHGTLPIARPPWGGRLAIAPIYLSGLTGFNDGIMINITWPNPPGRIQSQCVDLLKQLAADVVWMRPTFGATQGPIIPPPPAARPNEADIVAGITTYCHNRPRQVALAFR